jgi:NADH-quinone oxidoreductase subunit E
MPYDAPIESLDIREPMSREAAVAILSEHTRETIDHWRAKYPPERRRSAVLAALSEAQHQNSGYLTSDLMNAVAAYLELPTIYVYEAASFYSMYETRPVGRHSVSVCTNISCMTGESTSDGRIYLKREEECLAACCGAPMMMVDHVYYENLAPERVDEILDALE